MASFGVYNFVEFEGFLKSHQISKILKNLTIIRVESGILYRFQIKSA